MLEKLGASLWLKPFLATGWRFQLLAIFLIAMALAGGSARAGGGNALFVWPVSALVLAVGCAGLSRADLIRFRILLGLAAAIVGLVLAQLLPLPPGLWAALPGRQVVAAVSVASGNAALWRPLSISPADTRAVLWGLMPSLAVTALAVPMPAILQRKLLIPALLAVLASASLGAAQLLDDPHGPLYFYDNTNFGLPVGLFANRNHQATFLAAGLPMLALWGRFGPAYRHGSSVAVDWRRLAVAAALGGWLLLMIMLTGSRSGLLVAAVASLSVPLVLHGAWPALPQLPGRGSSRQRMMLAAVAGGALLTVAGVIAITVWQGRAEAINRLFAEDLSQDLRAQLLPTLTDMARQFWPWGSGLGSFLSAYRLFEPDAALAPEIMNRAHNDWLELVIAAGLPGIGLAVAALALWVARLRQVLPSDSGVHGTQKYWARAGLGIILLLALASLTDYPTTMPSLGCLLALAAVWAAAPAEGRSASPSGPIMRQADAD